MLIKRYSIFFIRRHRRYLLRVPFIILCLCLYFPIKHSFIDPLSKTIFVNNELNTNILDEKTNNCSGDPLKQWCANQINLCNSSIIVYNNLFVLTRSVVLQANLTKGKRLGGEDIKNVLNQPEQDEYFQFENEFIKLPCDVTALNGLQPNGHLAQIFSSIPSYKTYAGVHLINETTVAVNRQDYVNFYHTITDLYTVYLLCQFFQRDPKTVRILFLDAHPKGNLDILWSKLFHSFTRLGQLKNISSILYRELIWSQPQPESEIDIQRHRTVPPSFFSDFRQHILNQFLSDNPSNNKQKCDLVNIFLLLRGNYVAHPRNPSGTISRKLSNEIEILNLSKMEFSNSSNINFIFGYFEQLTIKEQLKTIVETDLFVGMHGAGLTHAIFLKPNRTLIELTSSDWESQNHYELLASISNVNYHRCTIIDGASTTAQTILSCIKEKISQMCPLMTMLTIANPTVTQLSTVSGNVSNNSTKD